MIFTFRSAAFAAALISLAQPALAQGTKCIEPDDLADATTYALPLAMEGVQAKCSDALPASSFVMSQGQSFAQKFIPLRDAAWPGARRVLVSFIESGTNVDRTEAQQAEAGMGGVIQTLMQMEGDELRPFVDAIATQLIAEDIGPSTCRDIEKVLPLLAPLPAENYGAILATIFGFVARDDETISICRADG